MFVDFGSKVNESENVDVHEDFRLWVITEWCGHDRLPGEFENTLVAKYHS